MSAATQKRDWRKRAMIDARDALACGATGAAWTALTRHEDDPPEALSEPAQKAIENGATYLHLDVVVPRKHLDRLCDEGRRAWAATYSAPPSDWTPSDYALYALKRRMDDPVEPACAYSIHSQPCIREGGHPGKHLTAKGFEWRVDA
jgi:hypothetical protein